MKFGLGFHLLYLYIKVNYILTPEVLSSFKFGPFNLYLDPLSIFYLYLMSTDLIGLNPRIEDEIRHQSVANGLQNFQSVTNPLPSIRLKIRRSDQTGSVLRIG